MLKVVFTSTGQAVMQDRVVNWCLSVDLHNQRFVPFISKRIPFFENSIPVDFTSLLGYPALFKDVKTHDVVFVKVLGPSLGNPIFDFIFD